MIAIPKPRLAALPEYLRAHGIAVRASDRSGAELLTCESGGARVLVVICQPPHSVDPIASEWVAIEVERDPFRPCHLRRADKEAAAVITALLESFRRSDG